jgi:hypothetical protein
MLAEPGRLQRFFDGLLAAQGALTDAIEPEGLEALLPAALQQALGVPEHCRFGFGATLPAGAQRVGIESDWLKRCAAALGEHGRIAHLVLDADDKLGDPEAALAQELTLDNATFRLVDSQPAWTRYLVLDFRYTALSDDKRDGMLRLILNLATGALPDVVMGRIASWLDNPGESAALPPDTSLPADWEPQRLSEVLHAALRARLDLTLEPFIHGLRRRLGRDQDRLYAYHNDLHREARLRQMALPAGDKGYEREQHRLDAIAREYRAKLDDLAHRYALRVSIEWVRTLNLIMPVQRLAVQIRRRKADRVIQLDWNRLARRIEPPACEDSFGPERPRLACDDAVHLVSTGGLLPCVGCGKTYCRACHPQACPKCHRRRG